MPASALEQYELELVNEARLDPLASAQRYISSYAPLTATQANIQNNLTYFHVDGAALLAAFSALQSVQPLAWNDALAAAAHTHDDTMISINQQTHQATGEANPGARMAAAGYATANTFSWGENVFAATQDPLMTMAGFMVDWGSGPNGMQSPAGHRTNLLSSSYREIGIGIAQTPTQSNVGPQVVTEDMASRGTAGAFILGVAYNDTDNNKFYSIGEGLGTLQISVAGAAGVASAAAGGYSAFTNTLGAQHIVFSGAGLSGSVDFATTLTSNENAKIDIVDGTTLRTSVSGTVTGAISLIVGLGLTGLSLTGDGHAQTIVGTKGNDTIDGGAGADTVIFSSNYAAYTLTDLGNGSVKVAGPDGTDTLKNIESLQFSDQTVQLPASGTPAAPTPPVVTPVNPAPPTNVPVASHLANSDFNGDGTADVVWFNPASHEVDVWKLNGGHWAGSVSMGSHPAGYQISGNGDFNHDGTSDVLWFNPVTIDTEVWMLNDGRWAGSVDIGSHPAGYQVAATGDFNRDGTSDVLWFNSTTKDAEIWMVNNGHWAGSTDIGTHPGNYQIAGTGDFNHDGTSDVLWFNPATNDAEIWLINNGRWAGSVDIGTHPGGYQIAATGDFNHDGTSDVLWFNSQTNDAEVWLLNNGHWQASVDIGAHPAGYQVTQAADFNNDGTDDILWFNPVTRDTEVWMISNGHWAGSVDIGTHPAGWVVA